ncbi:uncharacterized protein LOC142521788 [Primulina tabacum]|uniref:uncharacterized protein LOC142521788 n=1 Tax=Primulina tabacum TaxID=48773 RepID=UPI003F594B9B
MCDIYELFSPQLEVQKPREEGEFAQKMKEKKIGRVKQERKRVILMSNQERKRRNNILSFFQPRIDNHSSSERVETHASIHIEEPGPPSKSQRVVFDETSLEWDPGLRISMLRHPVNHRDELHELISKWGHINLNCRNTHEYSPSKDALFCFPWYLFELSEAEQSKFTIEGFRSWKRVNDGVDCAFLSHMGSSNSTHNKSSKSVVDLMNVTRHIYKLMNRETSEQIQKNRLRLAATIECIHWLILQACGLRDHDESSYSQNCGNFIEMLKLLGKWNASIGDIILDKAPGNARNTSPEIQKEILHIIGNRVRNKIRDEIGDSKFCILVDEAKDVSNKELMAIILRFVDAHGFLWERFFQIVNFHDTTAATLKKEICDVLIRYNLEIHNRLRPYAYYVHCFAHRLQLTLVVAAEKEISIWLFFSNLTTVVNLVTSSSKRNVELKSYQVNEIARSIVAGERETTRGANQIGNLHRADFQLEELNSRFSDETVELLILCSALDPKDNFKWFNIDKICILAEKYYPEDFTEQEIHHLRCQLQHFELDVVCHEDFQVPKAMIEI